MYANHDFGSELQIALDVDVLSWFPAMTLPFLTSSGLLGIILSHACTSLEWFSDSHDYDVTLENFCPFLSLKCMQITDIFHISLINDLLSICWISSYLLLSSQVKVWDCSGIERNIVHKKNKKKWKLPFLSQSSRKFLMKEKYYRESKSSWIQWELGSISTTRIIMSWLASGRIN